MVWCFASVAPRQSNFLTTYSPSPRFVDSPRFYQTWGGFGREGFVFFDVLPWLSLALLRFALGRFS
jgi:hypothetical protein